MGPIGPMERLCGTPMRNACGTLLSAHCSLQCYLSCAATHANWSTLKSYWSCVGEAVATLSTGRFAQGP